MPGTRRLTALCLAATLLVALAGSCSASGPRGGAVGVRSGANGTSGGAGAAGGGAEAAGGASRGAGSGRLHLVKVGDFQQPIYLAGAPGDRRRVFVVERAGRIRLVLAGRVLARPFLDVSAKVGSDGQEQGLLSLAFAPDYARSGRFYIDYTDHAGNIHVEQLRRSPDDPNTAAAGSARAVLRIDHHLYSNHNGGQLQFGPEGDLYIGVGDGGSEGDPSGNGQNRGTLLAKILRIAPGADGGYTIPAGNPFAGRSGARPEIWAYGLRNPWRFSFDRTGGALILGDVGQDRQEEIDYAPRGTGAGANYGWSVVEGDRRNKPGRAPGAVAPVLVATHSDGYCAIIGGYVVRDRGLPGLYGRYLFGDLCQGEIQAVRLGRGRASAKRGIGLSVKDMASFGEDAAGRVYVVSLDGPVYRLAGG